jgi:hypothetical protein
MDKGKVGNIMEVERKITNKEILNIQNKQAI